jgi:hypothetical protein
MDSAVIAARDRAVTALLDYADALESQQRIAARHEVLTFVRRLMEQPQQDRQSGFVSQGFGGKREDG